MTVGIKQIIKGVKRWDFSGTWWCARNDCQNVWIRAGDKIVPQSVNFVARYLLHTQCCHSYPATAVEESHHISHKTLRYSA